MLLNPDIAPSASINRWIVAILTFHFSLVHVAGSHHRPDGLSRCSRQPDNSLSSYDEEETDDWINKLQGFLHQINDPHRPRSITTTVAVLALDSTADADIQSVEDSAPDIEDYSSVPCSHSAVTDDLRLIKVQQWHSDLVRPSDLTDTQYATFIPYCQEFFLDRRALWRKDSHGEHKLVVDRTA